MVQNVVSFIMLDHATSIENAPVHYHSRWTESCKLWSICRQILFIQSPTRSRWTIETHVSSGGGPHMLCVWSARGLKELNLQRVIDWLKKSEEERGNFSISDLKNIYTTIIKTFHCGRSEVAPLNWAFWRHSWGWICVPNGNRDVEWKCSQIMKGNGHHHHMMNTVLQILNLLSRKTMWNVPCLVFSSPVDILNPFAFSLVIQTERC